MEGDLKSSVKATPGGLNAASSRSYGKVPIYVGIAVRAHEAMDGRQGAEMAMEVNAMMRFL